MSGHGSPYVNECARDRFRPGLRSVRLVRHGTAGALLFTERRVRLRGVDQSLTRSDLPLSLKEPRRVHHN